MTRSARSTSMMVLSGCSSANGRFRRRRNYVQLSSRIPNTSSPSQKVAPSPSATVTSPRRLLTGTRSSEADSSWASPHECHLDAGQRCFTEGGSGTPRSFSRLAVHQSLQPCDAYHAAGCRRPDRRGALRQLGRSPSLSGMPASWPCSQFSPAVDRLHLIASVTEGAVPRAAHVL
jgi:hypothetical protein